MTDRRHNRTMRLALVRNGNARFSLEVRPPQDAEPLQEVLAELVTHLERCLEKPVQWFDRHGRNPSPVRLVLNFDVTRRLGREAFEIVADRRSLRLTGATVQALDHAVHYFLEKAFGIRWLWPGEDGTVTPRATNISWPIGRRTEKPDWYWRRMWAGGGFWEGDDQVLTELKRDRVSFDTLRELQLWRWRNRLGGIKIADGHHWIQMCSPLRHGKRHPEYFALFEGKRDAEYFDGGHFNQLCTSNPDVVRTCAEYVKAVLRARPELDGYSVSPNDDRHFCECEPCRSIDEWARSAGSAPAPPDPDSITDRIVLFTNRIADIVAEEHPEKLLQLWTRTVCEAPPRRVSLHPTVIAQFCFRSWSHAHEPLRRRDLALLRSWRGLAHRFGVFDYFVNGANGAMPRGFARVFARSLKSYHRLGCRYFSTLAGLDFATSGFTYYLAARCLWNVKTSADEVLQDYCRSAFGPGAAHMRRYFTAFMDRWEETAAGAKLGVEVRHEFVEQLAPKLYPRRWRSARRAELRAALKACRLHPSCGKRVAFIRKGLDFLDLLVPACQAVADLAEAGVSPESAGSARPTAVRRALRMRERLLAWVHRHRNGFWIAAMWFDYQRLQRANLLGTWLDEVASAAGLQL